MRDAMHDENQLRRVLQELEQLRSALVDAEHTLGSEIQAVSADFRESARNLVHYVTLRQFDVRPLQSQLAALGLSSLGRAEANVLDTIDAVARLLRAVLRDAPEHVSHRAHHPIGERTFLRDHTRALLGAADPPLVMVTMPSQAATDPTLVRDLLAAGMSVMRINAAHDDPTAWRAMIAHLTRARAELHRECCVLLDLPGPKLRTLDVEPGPRVVRFHPQRDACGRLLVKARVFLARGRMTSRDDADATLQLPEAWVESLEVGDVVRFEDLRGRTRRLRIVAREPGGAWAESSRTAYIGPETALTREGDADTPRITPLDIPALAGALTLHVGDELELRGDGAVGHPALSDAEGRIVRPASIACAAPEVLSHVRAGEPVWFDDGKIGGHVDAVSPGSVRVRITQAKPGGSKLGADKGINLPETWLDLATLGPADQQALDVAVTHADLVGLSFARTVDDVRALHDELARRDAAHLGIVLKIETKLGFEHLPRMLLEALQRPPVGVMIARGDLAVECGFEWLAELQEEILWICEAAHVPCIWATQVLEQLTKKGVASRAEITDAAMAERAECVMLNKGPHVVRAVAVLSDILARMRDHQHKKTSMLRPLKSLRLDGTPPSRPPPVA